MANSRVSHLIIKAKSSQALIPKDEAFTDYRKLIFFSPQSVDRQLIEMQFQAWLGHLAKEGNMTVTIYTMEKLKKVLVKLNKKYQELPPEERPALQELWEECLRKLASNNSALSQELLEIISK